MKKFLKKERLKKIIVTGIIAIVISNFIIPNLALAKFVWFEITENGRNKYFYRCS